MCAVLKSHFYVKFFYILNETPNDYSKLYILLWYHDDCLDFRVVSCVLLD